MKDRINTIDFYTADAKPFSTEHEPATPRFKDRGDWVLVVQTQDGIVCCDAIFKGTEAECPAAEAYLMELALLHWHTNNP